MKYLFGIIFLLVISCKKKADTIAVNETPVEGLSLFDEKNEYVFNNELNDSVSHRIKEWKEYFAMSKYLKKNFTLISPSLSLEMSKDLSDLVKNMMDSLTITELNNRGVFARLNTLNSEVLRLKDMSTIPSIQPSEISSQVKKVVSVYNSINSKINSVYSQKDFDENVDFDESIFNFNEAAERPYLVPRKQAKQKAYVKKNGASQK